MNRQQRRAQAKREEVPIVPSVSGAPSPPSVSYRPPGLALRLFSRVLLSDWVLKRVSHPDVITILLQVAEQSGRADAVARLTAKLMTSPK